MRACVFVLGDEGAKPEMEWWRGCFQESGSIQNNFVLPDGRGFDCYIISQLTRFSDSFCYEGKSISNYMQPMQFSMDRDGHDFMPCFNTCFIRGYKIARLSSYSSIRY